MSSADLIKIMAENHGLFLWSSEGDMVYPTSLESILEFQPLLKREHLDTLSSWIFAQCKELFPHSSWVGQRIWLLVFTFLAEVRVKSLEIVELLPWGCIWLIFKENGLPLNVAGFPVLEDESKFEEIGMYVLAKTMGKVSKTTPLEKCAFLLEKVGYIDEEMEEISEIMEGYFATYKVLGQTTETVAAAAVVQYLKQAKQSSEKANATAKIQEIAKVFIPGIGNWPQLSLI